jgi:predicted DNA-binding transcriptional regulator AlpA
MDSFLNEKQLAAYLGISVAALRAWRLKGLGPRFVKLGSAVRYDPAAVQAWLVSCPSGGSH